MRIAVVDGQGGGVGKALVEKLRHAFGKEAYILALGTNSHAASIMLKAGADAGASGENAIVANADRVRVIVGALGVVAADSMLGEITPAMARAIAQSGARKILVPVNRCGLTVAGVKNLSFGEYVAEAVEAVRALRIGDAAEEGG
ncbi:MAG: DUF3842 family protein [Planctomycetota bacterium]|nr:DUF3842 family protein [Planctomycetota bacterium]